MSYLYAGGLTHEAPPILPTRRACFCGQCDRITPEAEMIGVRTPDGHGSVPHCGPCFQAHVDAVYAAEGVAIVVCDGCGYAVPELECSTFDGEAICGRCRKAVAA